MPYPNSPSPAGHSDVTIKRSSRFLIGILLVLVLGLMPDEVEAQKWNTNNSGNWGDSTKWTPNTVPDGVGVTANLSFNITATRTITLDIDPTVGTLIFGDTNNTHAFIISGGTLTFDNGNNGALLNHNSATANLSPSGSDRIDSNVVIADLLGLTIDADRNLEFRGAWDGGNSTINLINTGRVFWNNNTGSGTLSNLSVLNILNGEARFDGVAGTANSQLIGATTINLGDGFVTTGGTGFRVFARLNLVNTETTQTATLNLNGGWLTSDLGNNDNLDIWSGNINLMGAANTNVIDVNDAGTADTHIVSGVIGGTGGFSKINTGTLELTANNVFSGELFVQRGGVGGSGITSEGSVRLSGNSGSLSQVDGITMSRDGSLYLDNSSSINSNRINDLGTLTLRGSGRLRMIGNGTSPTSETIGTLIQDTGSGKVNFDLDDSTPQSTSLTFATYQRNPGSITQFQVLENTPGAFGSALGGSALLFIADGGASSVKLGGGGINGGTTAMNRTLLVGAYGGVNNFSNHFMTFDDASPTELRPLSWTGTQATSEYFLSRDSLSPAHQFTRSGLGSVDQNVNLNFNVGIEGDIGSGLPGSGSDYGWFGKAPMAILENVAMNSLRFGTNTPSSTVNTNNSNEIGSTLVLAPGAILYLGDKPADSELPAISSSGSGMILFGRDVDGTAPGSNQMIAGGVLSFGSREALLVNESGNSAYFRSDIRGTGGLTKAGANSIYLDNSNSYSGDTNIAEGVLVLRDRNALGASGLVKIEGSGQLYLELGTQIIDNTAGPTAPDLFVGSIDGSRPVLYSNGSNNTWGGNVIIDTVDNLGNWVFTPRIATNARDTLNIEGDIYGNEIANPINTDTALNDARLVSTVGGSTSGGIINLNGRFRDNALGPIASTVNSNNENQLLRFQVASSNELIVNVRQQWDAAGIILLDQGILRYEGDGNFWSDTAAANLNAANGQSGFRMGGSGGSSTNNNNSSFNSAFILTKPGQALNIGRIDIGGDGTNNFNGKGNTMLAGTNTSGSVSFGNGSERIVFNGSSSTNAFHRDLTVYQAEGGTMELNFRLDDTDADSHTSLTKIGRGVVNFNGQNDVGGTAQNGDVEQLNISGGLLRLTNYGAATGRRFDTGAMIYLSGGGLEMDASGSIQNETANYTGAAVLGTSGFPVAQTLITAGATDVIVTSATGRTTTMNIGSTTLPTNRLSGGTLNFVENGNGGTSNITLQGSGAGGIQANDTAYAWATYGDTYTFNPAAATYTVNAIDFAMTTGSGDLTAFTGATRENNDAVSTWATPGNDLSENTAGFDGSALAASFAVNTLHFDFDGAGSVDATNGLEVTSGGILVSSSVITGNKSIIGGTLMAGAGNDLIVHQYGGAAMTISSVIQDNAGSNALVKAGSGTLLLTGNNTYTGRTFLNGGTLSISSDANLGTAPGTPVADALYMNGGSLLTTADFTLDGNRGITLGGNGGELNVSAGTTLTYSGTIASEPNLIAGYAANPAVGRVDKTGEGTLILTGINNSFNGLLEIREGTLRWEGQTTNSGTRNPFGSNSAFLDGTIVRSGATLEIHPTSASNTGTALTQTLNEWFTFEGGSTLDLAPSNTAASPHNNSINFRGVIQLDSLGNPGTPDGFQTPSSLAGFTVIRTVRGSNYLNDDGGYITGDGGIIKVGAGYLGIREHNPEWTGQIIVSEGHLELFSAGDPGGRGTLPIILGHNLFAEQAGETVTGNNTVTLTVRDEGGYRDVSTVPQDIIVRNDDGAGAQTKRIGARYLANIDVVNYDGSLTLRDDIQFFYQDDARDAANTSAANTRNDTRSNGTLENMETVFINFNGDITGAVGNDISTNVTQAGTSNVVNGSITAPFDDLVIRAVFGLNGDNSGWAGNLAIGNTNAGGDVDTQHIVAIGNSLAISSINDVTLHSNASFRTSGHHVVIGNLLDGSAGVERYLENSSAVASGSITITQTVDQTVNVVLRDGETVFILQPGESFQSLSFEKAGPALLGLTQANSFTGTTTLSGGTLQLAFGSDQSMLSDTAALILNDGILDLAGTVAHGEIVGSTVVNGTVAIERSTGSSVIHLNTITRNAGTLRLSGDDIATTDNANINGILGGWATVGGSFATNSGVMDPGGNGGFIRALATFDQEIERLGGGTGTQVIADGVGDNVNIIEGGSISSPITLGVSGGTTNIYTLRQGAAGGTATIDIGGGNTLRIASGGIILPDGSGSLVFANSGSLTAGTGSSPATLFLQSQDTDPSPLTTQALILGTSIVDNGTGSVDVRTAGPGFTVFTGNNSYSGSTLVGSGILAIGDGGISGNLGSGAVTIEASGTLAFNRSDNALAVAGALTGSGTIVQNGSGTTTLGAAAGSSALNFILAQGTLATAVDSAINTTGSLTFGDSVGSSTVSTLDLTSGSATVGSLVVQTNSSSANQLLIGSGKTLFVNGPVTIGADANASTTVLTAGGGGNLVVQSGGTNFQVGGATGATNENLASADLSGLASFTADLGAGAFRIGDVNSGTTANGSSLKLASVSNVITAGTIQVGDGSGGVSLHTLTLGTGTNTLNADVINIGSAVSRIRSSGEIVFDSLDTTGSLKIRSSDGSGRALINLVNTTGSTGGNMTGELLLAGHSADLLASSVTLSNRTANTGNATSRLTFDEGQLDILTLYIANRGGTGSGNAIATVSLGDSAAPGVPTSNIGMIEMGVNSSTNAGSVVTADLEITGGLVNVGTGSGVAINMANAVAGRTSTSTIEVSSGILTLTGDVVRSGGGGTEDTSFIVSGGTVDFSGNRLGTSSEVVTLSAQSGMIRNLGELNGGGTFEKTTNGTLILEGSNTYTGATTISEGTLQLGSGGTDGTLHTDSLVSIASGAVFAVHQSDLVVQGVDFNGSPISGDGAFEQRGSGTTVLTAANTFNGGVSVNDGILLVNNTTGSGTGSGAVTVSGDAVLGGNGIISGNTNLGTGTTLSAGDPAVSAGIGTLTFGGDLTLATGSTWLIDLVQDVNGSSDLIDVSSGTLNLNSASLGLNTTGAISYGNVYTIATFNSLAGTFNGLNEGAVISNYQISYGQVTAGAITLTAVPEPGTLGFLGLALGGFAWRRWRRRRAS